MKLRLLFLALLATGVSRANTPVAPESKPPRITENPKTFCNPIKLDYRIQPDNPLRSEAADAGCVFFKGEYYLFASKSCGYVDSCGIGPDCLNLHFEVRGATAVERRCLDIREAYHFTVRAFNESGTSKPGDLRKAH